MEKIYRKEWPYGPLSLVILREQAKIHMSEGRNDCLCFYGLKT